MDVTCERCSTEYEFDDALVSGRGTTVKCTNCGHQFKVRKQEGGAPERWVVRTVDGRELDFTALRDLQSAIANGRVTRDDVLSRGGSRPRRLGSIAELEPFFASAGGGLSTATAPGLGGPRSRAGMGSMSGSAAARGSNPDHSVAIPLPTAPPGATRAFNDQPTMVRPKLASGHALPPPRTPSRPPPPYSEPLPSFPSPDSVDGPDGGETFVEADLATTSTDAAAYDPSGQGVIDGAVTMTLPKPKLDAIVAARPPARPASLPPPPPPRGQLASVPNIQQEPAARSAPAKKAEPAKALPAPSEPPPPPKRAASDPPPKRPAPGPRMRAPGLANIANGPHSSDGRPSLVNDETYGESRGSMAPSSLSGPRRGGAARYIVGSIVAGVVALVAVKYGRQYLVSAKSAEAAPDERISKLVDDGEKSLGEGNIEGAKTQFDKASALAERDPRVLVQLARLAVVRADFAWLHARLVPEGDPDLPTVVKERETLGAAAKAAVDAAMAVAPEDPALARLRADAMRLGGDVAGGRKLAPLLSAGAGPGGAEAQLSLAALDLTEESPNYPTVLERLKAAAAAEGQLGRGRAMLAYALARSGDVAGAKAEFAKITARPTPHPLTQPLRAYLARLESTSEADKALATAQAEGVEIPSDAREAMRRGNEALARGDHKRAELMFQAALKKKPGDVEAMTGLANVAKGRKDRGEALRLYQQAVDANPGFLPAMIALADLKWEGGDRDAALALYKTIAERDADGAYGARARAKIQGGSVASGPGNTGPKTTATGKTPDGRVPDNYVYTGDPAATGTPAGTGAPATPTAATGAPAATSAPTTPPPTDPGDLPGRIP